MYEEWLKALASHPDHAFTDYLLSGIRNGFHIGFDRRHSCQRSTGNMQSAILHSQPVEDYLNTELRAGRIIGPLSDTKSVQVSRFGVIPKAGQPDKWRLILDLSSPHGHSVNDGISKDLCSLKYATVDQAVRRILQLGEGSYLAKIDIQHAFRNIPVNPEDRIYLGMSWRGDLYIDTVLPFGLRSAPKIINAIADAAEWILLHTGVTNLMHYLDDFLTIGSPRSTECRENLQAITATCQKLGLPLKEEKVEGPATSLIFLGIQLDTLSMEMRLPDAKLKELQDLLVAWSTKRAVKKRDLLSLIGKLSHAAKIILPGRIFLRRMIDTASKAKQLDHWVHLTADFRSDLAWWCCFIKSWNGRAMMQVLANAQPPTATITTDASGTWGCGAFWVEAGQWIQCPWRNEWQNTPIHAKELLPIILAIATWGPYWRPSPIKVLCDNMAVVNIITSNTSRDKLVMHLLRGLHFVSAFYSIQVKIQHIAGSDNTIADAISRDHLQVFFNHAPAASPEPTPIPDPLWSILVSQQPDWLSATWQASLTSSLAIALQRAQERPIPLLKLST